MEKDDKADFVIEDLFDNLDFAEDSKASEDEIEENETEDWEDYQENKIVKLKEENLLLTDQLICMEQKLEVLCRMMNLEKDNFEKQWKFLEETLLQTEESNGKAQQNLTEDSFLAKMHLLLIEKILLGKKTQEAIVDWNQKKRFENLGSVPDTLLEKEWQKLTEEYSGCLVTGDPSSAEITDLKESAESTWLKAAQDITIPTSLDSFCSHSRKGVDGKESSQTV